MFGRYLEYLGRLWRELRPTALGQDRYHVAAVVVNLTGVGNTSCDMVLGSTGLRTCLTVRELNLASELAETMLLGVAEDRIGRSLLPFVPLMQSGSEPGIMERWRELAAAEPDRHLRGDLAALAMLFADALNAGLEWEKSLEEWNVEESQTVLKWMAKGEIRSCRATLRMLLEDRFGTVPATLARRIDEVDDLDVLKSAIRQVHRVQSIGEIEL